MREGHGLGSNLNMFTGSQINASSDGRALSTTTLLWWYSGKYFGPGILLSAFIPKYRPFTFKYVPEILQSEASAHS
jgi:hypothetical protein